jgi:hypothetical protein
MRFQMHPLASQELDEGLIRNAPGFSRFFEAMALSHGQPAVLF